MFTRFVPRVPAFSAIAIAIAITAAASLLIATPSAAIAAPVAVVNPGFEDISGQTTSNEFTFGPLNGWQLYDPTDTTSDGDGPDFFIGTLTPQEVNNPGVIEYFPGGAAEGSRMGIAFNFANTDANVEYGFTQTLLETVTANTTYTLDVEIGNIASGQSVDNQIFNLDGFPGYRVDLLAIDQSDNVTVLASDGNTLDGLIAEGEFETSTVTYDTGDTPTTLGQNLAIRLVNLNIIDTTNEDTIAADREVDFDDIRLDASLTVVPEPASLAILALGATALIARRSHR